MNETSAMIEVTDLSKNFEEFKAVDKISFEVKRGELFGFLGPNGAGKTTTINMLTGLARPNDGQIKISHIDCIKHPRAAQHLIGVVPDESNLYPELSGFENLCFCASLYGISKTEREKRARQLLETFALSEAANKKFAKYSKGMKRKLTIAAGIIHNPEILFLDEPTTGIDVASARHLRKLIQDLNAQGTTIFLTTHYIEEAERLCDQIAFIVNGKIVRIDTVTNLIQPIKSKNVVQLSCSNDFAQLADDLNNSFKDLEFNIPDSKKIRIESNNIISLAPIFRFLEEKGIEIFEARRIRPTLEEVFVKITGIEVKLMQIEKAGKGK
ncbi:MAG: ABC transporter ATP-binding protein [Candidatus Rifleibacteriota bacterium]